MGVGPNSHCTNEMIRPVLPPIRPKALPAVETAPETREPPELVTLVRPSEALETNPDADSLAFDAVSAAVEACLRLCRRRRKPEWRRSARVAGAGTMALLSCLEAPCGRW